MCHEIWSNWGRSRNDQQRKADLEALVQAPPAEVQQQARLVVREVAANQPPAIQFQLESYLNQVPPATRRSLRRREDPRGRTVPPNLPLTRAEDLAAVLPRLSRFKPGDRPLPGVSWELERLLGTGGFGEVWKARNPNLTGFTAALKFCLDPDASKSLRHEAVALNRVMQAGKHPGIVALRQAYLDNDPICLEYEYVEGGDLGGLIQELHQRGKMKPEEVARWLLHLANPIRFAHQMKPPLVHRDLKPANILVQRGPEGKFSLRVADFGISSVAASHALGEDARTPTCRASPLTTAVRGAYTPIYASPQQIKGEPADPRDDVHALGVIWYQMLTGELGQGLPIDWRDELAERGIPNPMIDLLARCVASRPERRLANAAELAQQLEALCQAGRRQRSPQPDPVPCTAADDLAAQVEDTMQSARQTHAEAKQKAERDRNFAGAAHWEALKTQMQKQVRASDWDGAWQTVDAMLAIKPYDRDILEVRDYLETRRNEQGPPLVLETRRIEEGLPLVWQGGPSPEPAPPKAPAPLAHIPLSFLGELPADKVFSPRTLARLLEAGLLQSTQTRLSAADAQGIVENYSRRR
jgi:serine/threonine protein kinase